MPVSQLPRFTWPRIGAAVRLLSSFGRARQGASAVTLALSLPVVLGAGGFAVDYAAVNSTTNRLQALVDSSALAVAREMTVSTMTAARAQTLSEQYVAANIPANTPYKISVVAALVENSMAVQVSGTQQVATPFGFLEHLAGVTNVSATALARVTASSTPTKLCLLSLGEKIDGGVYMHNGAQISAPGCVIQSNSTKNYAVILDAGSKIRSQLLCAKGGIKNMASMVDASLVTDCPTMTDPLAMKPEPAPAATCTASGLKLKAGLNTLNPGTYCNGVTISKTARVKLNPGVYHFKDGPLLVQNDAEFTGDGVTLMFAGKKAYFRFLDNSLITLTAPTSGATAGMLIWESQLIPGTAAWWNGGCGGNSDDNDDNNGSSCTPPGSTVKAKKTNEHHISSIRARTLTGTIYLKKGLLLIDSAQPIADLSPYTLMVVNKLDLFDGPILTLNSNYAGSSVPVPAGLGTIGATQLRLGM
jgi:Flp pilus assembly protein TadG